MDIKRYKVTLGARAPRFTEDAEGCVVLYKDVEETINKLKQERNDAQAHAYRLQNKI